MRLRAFTALVAGAAMAAGTLASAAMAAEFQRPDPSAYVERNFEPTPRRIVYTAARSLGMLRGLQESDLLVRMRFKGAGALWRPARTGAWAQVPVSSYYGEISYPVEGMRIDITTPQGRTVEAVAEGVAWDEQGLIPDGPPVGTSQTVTPAAVAWRELLLDMTPYGAIQLAHANQAQVKVAAQPRGIYVLTFPYKGQTMKVTLDRNRRPSRIETTAVHPAIGRTPVVMEYSGYNDFEPLSEFSDEPWSFAYFPSRIVQKLGDKPILDVKIDTCWCTNPYVVFDPPATTVASNAR